MSLIVGAAEKKEPGSWVVLIMLIYCHFEISWNTCCWGWAIYPCFVFQGRKSHSYRKVSWVVDGQVKCNRFGEWGKWYWCVWCLQFRWWSHYCQRVAPSQEGVQTKSHTKSPAPVAVSVYVFVHCVYVLSYMLLLSLSKANSEQGLLLL